MDGNQFHNTKVIQGEVGKYFEGLFQEWRGFHIEDQIWGVQEFPVMFLEEDNIALKAVVITSELERVLKTFSSEKSLSPDGWTIEFFVHFSEHLLHDITNMV